MPDLIDAASESVERLPFGLIAMPIAVQGHCPQPHRKYIEVYDDVRKALADAAKELADAKAAITLRDLQIEGLKSDLDDANTKVERLRKAWGQLRDALAPDADLAAKERET